MIEYGLRYFDPDICTMENPRGDWVTMPVHSREIAEHAVKVKIPMKGQQHHVVCREVTEWTAVE